MAWLARCALRRALCCPLMAPGRQGPGEHSVCRSEWLWDVKHCGNDQRAQCISSGDALSSVECYISRFCFRHVLFPMRWRLSASTAAPWPQPEISSLLCGMFKAVLQFSCLFCFHLFCGLDCLIDPRPSSLPSSFLSLALCLFQTFTLSPLFLSLFLLPPSVPAACLPLTGTNPAPLSLLLSQSHFL